MGASTPVDLKGLSASLPKPSGGKEIAVPAGPRNGGNLKKKALTFSGGDYRKRESTATAFELRQLARAVRQIHDPMRSNPEAVCVAKDQIATRLFRLADAMEAAHG